MKPGRSQASEKIEKPKRARENSQKNNDKNEEMERLGTSPV